MNAKVAWGIIGIGGLAAAIGLAMYLNAPQKPEVESGTVAEKPADATEPAAETKLPAGQVVIGGVQRPASDVQIEQQGAVKKRPIPKKPEGGTPRIDATANPQVQMVAAALNSGKHPERTSSLVVPHNFDADAFKQRKAEYAEEYAAIVEPGRVFAPAQPTEGVSAIQSMGTRHHRVIQGEKVRLKTKVDAFAPVTFTSFSYGQFENLLSSITVVADGDGQAVAEFTASSGTKGRVKILAASPVNADQIEFAVAVRLP